jgi:hypothetical protein
LARVRLDQTEKADTNAFLKEIFQILPVVGLRVFEFAKAVATPKTPTLTPPQKEFSKEPDTIVVPAQKDGFEKVFLGQDCWYAIRISAGMLDKIKYIAAYQTTPVMAITHYAPVDRIEPYGEDGKYKVVFALKARELPRGIIPLADANGMLMAAPRYTTLARLLAGKKLADVVGKSVQN